MPTAEDNFFQKKHTASIAYLVGVLLFFLPFVEIKCNDVPFAQNTGVGLAFGADYKVTGSLKSLEGQAEKSETATTKEKGKLYVLALVALILGVTGLALSLSGNRFRFGANMLIGTLAALSLIILMIQINGDVKAGMKNPARDSDFSPAVKVSIDYTFWFYLSVVSFLAAAFFSHKHRQIQQRSGAAIAQPADPLTEVAAFGASHEGDMITK